MYKRVSGPTTDYLTITNAGASGRFTYEYVGSAFWQRVTDGTTAITGSFDAFLYGFPSSPAAIATGNAIYDVDVIGAVGLPTSLDSYNGQGLLLVDFATNALFVDASLTSSSLGSGLMQGKALIGSGSNAFTGTIGANFVEHYAGPISGWFFGPTAQEVGATFRGGTPSGSSVMTGTVMGRRHSGPGNTTFMPPLTEPEMFSGAFRSASFTRNGDSAPTAVQTAAGLLTVGYDPRNGLNLFFLPTGADVRTGPNQSDPFFGGYAGLNPGLETSGGWWSYAFQDYVRAGRLVTKTGTSYRFDEFFYGFDTKFANLPTGTGSYSVAMVGTLFATDAAPVALSGLGLVTADFAAGTISGGGSVRKEVSGYPVIGDWSGSATLAAQSNRFSGPWSVTGQAGGANFSGTWNGGFFGPTADNVAALANGTAADGALMLVNISGKTRASAGAVPALGGLAAQTSFDGSPTALLIQASAQPAEFGRSTGPVTVTYDPAGGNYNFSVQPPPFGFSAFEPKQSTWTGNDKVAAESDASYDVYRKANGDTMRVLSFSSSVNPVIDLTYTSFAEVTQLAKDMANRDLVTRQWTLFGSRTPTESMPKFGSATYSGRAFGGGYVQGLGQDARVDGSFGLSVTFSDSRYTSSLDLVAHDRAGALADVALGSLTFAGFLNGNQFSALSETFGLGDIGGWFYGPDAQEVGGNFSMRRDNGASVPGVDVRGIFVGKKN